MANNDNKCNGNNLRKNKKTLRFKKTLALK